MLYYVLGILTAAAIHLISFLKCYEHDVKVNRKHMTLSVLFSVYLVFVVEFLHTNVIGNGMELLILVGIFLPFGIIMPIIYPLIKLVKSNYGPAV